MGSRGNDLFKMAKPQKSTTVRHFWRFFTFPWCCVLARNCVRERSRERCENRFVFVSILIPFWPPLWGPWGAWKNSKTDVGASGVERKRILDFLKGVLEITFGKVFLDIGPGSFLIDFWSIYDRFLTVFSCIFVCFLFDFWNPYGFIIDWICRYHR